MAAADLRLRLAREGDVLALANNMRLLDRIEVRASSGLSALDALRLAVKQSDPGLLLAAEHQGRLAAMFGVAPQGLATGSGCVWMLGTPELDVLGRSLGRIARRYIREALEEYPVLFNYVDARNAPSLRLIEWLGFEIAPAEPYGHAGLPFHRFELRKSDPACVAPRPQAQAH